MDELEDMGGSALFNLEAKPEAVYDVPVRVSTVLGKSRVKVSDLLVLNTGAIVELDRKINDPIEIYVNDQLVARGELVVSDGRLGVTMTEIIKTDLRKDQK